jgi:hypothetical protein
LRIASAASALYGAAEMAVNQGNVPRTRPRNSQSSTRNACPQMVHQASDLITNPQTGARFDDGDASFS